MGVVILMLMIPRCDRPSLGCWVSFFVVVAATLLTVYLIYVRAIPLGWGCLRWRLPRLTMECLLEPE
jgi:hypothetical protein